jgi:hypothetical protein
MICALRDMVHPDSGIFATRSLLQGCIFFLVDASGPVKLKSLSNSRFDCRPVKVRGMLRQQKTGLQPRFIDFRRVRTQFGHAP